ncbi:MAG: hypothetical protein AAGA56_05835, partial [Myxococcota bacterium]
MVPQTAGVVRLLGIEWIVVSGDDRLGPVVVGLKENGSRTARLQQPIPLLGDALRPEEGMGPLP